MVSGPFKPRYPTIAEWLGRGWIEIGSDDISASFVRASDIGGMVFEGKPHYNSIDDALQDLEVGIRQWLEENPGRGGLIQPSPHR